MGGSTTYGDALGDLLGYSVNGAGDFNGDGFDDVIIAAPGVDGGGTAHVIFGYANSEVAAGGKTVSFFDWDGDLVTIKTSKGDLDASQFKLSAPNHVTGGSHLIYADFSGAEFSGANISITAKRGPIYGDGLVNVETVNAHGTALGKLILDGDLGRINAAALKSLTVYSLGQFYAIESTTAHRTSVIDGKLGALTVKSDASRAIISDRNYRTDQRAKLPGRSDHGVRGD